jgi:hypothetical protein
MNGTKNRTNLDRNKPLRQIINNHKNMNLTKVVDPPINTNIPKQVPMLTRDEFMKVPKIITTYGMIGQLQNTSSCSSCGK